jgi:hypothetical protein
VPAYDGGKNCKRNPMTAATDPRFERWCDLVLASVPALASDAAQRALEQLQGSALSNAVAGDRQHTVGLLALLRPAPGSRRRSQQLPRCAGIRARAARRIGHARRCGLGGADRPVDLVDDQQIEEDIEVARHRPWTPRPKSVRDLRPMPRLRSAQRAARGGPLRPECPARSARCNTGLDRPVRMLAAW